MILVTGAGGKTGQAVLEALAERQVPARALIRRAAQTEAVSRSGAGEVLVGDLRNTPDLVRALDGVRSVYFIAPNLHPDETGIGRRLIEAARSTDVERIVYHSVLHPQTRAMPHHWQKLAVEELLLESGLAFTILQPGAYMQNVLAYREAILSEFTYAVPYGVGGALSLVDLEDVAEAAARVLTGGDHSGATYELAGPEALSPEDIALQLSERLERTVRASQAPIPAWADEARSSGLGGYAVDALARMFEYYDKHGLRGNPQVLTWLLGRPPTAFRAFVERTFAAG